MFITHAQTAEELRVEVISDLTRRLDILQAEQSNAKSAAEKARVGRAIYALEEMQRFWKTLTIAKRERGKASV